MKRHDFLADYWTPYPGAQPNWRDVADFTSERRDCGFVCGRLLGGGGGGSGGVGEQQEQEHNRVLHWGDARLPFRFSAAVTWTVPPRKTTPFRADVLENGDLLCLYVRRASESPPAANGVALSDEIWIADEVTLLAPSQNAYSVARGFSVRRSREWASFIASVREFFTGRDFVEALTPTLVPSPGTEPYLDAFSTTLECGRRTRTLFLPTSPEFHLKKMLASGWSRLFEIKSCFRNGEIGAHHQPEFQMLEWYRAFSDLEAIAADVDALITFLSDRLEPKRRPRALRRTTLAELFASAYNGFRLHAGTTREDLARLYGASFTMPPSAADSFDELFFRLFLERIEPELGRDGPLLVTGYPAPQAALARVGTDGMAERFEIYWRGLEIANAFHELNDPAENETRFRADRERKLELGKPAVPVDEELFRALRFGLPPSGGIALGLDRLFMALFDINEISETRAFPIANAVEGQ